MKKFSAYVLGFTFVLVSMISMSSSVGAQTIPTGCNSTSGYSSTNGAPCNGTNTIPSGCNSTSGYSSTTGNPCNGLTLDVNGGVSYPVGCSSSNGNSVITNYPCNGTSGYLNGVYYNVQGCSSTSGYSPISGLSCSSVGGVLRVGNDTYYPGCTSFSGFSTTTDQACFFASLTNDTTTPDLPTTGAGSVALLEVLALGASLGVAMYGVKGLFKKS